MSTQDEQKVKYWGGQHPSVLKRHGSRTADDCAAFLYPYLDKLPQDFSFLDLGCGPGSITTDLALKYPHATFLGIDTSSSAISAATSLAATRKATNATFTVGDILDHASLPHRTWDVVYCHQVLIHMSSATEGLRIMKTLARPDGGIVGAREAFKAGLSYWPESAELKEWVDLLMGQIERLGNDAATGQKLIGFALGAGWKRDQITHTLGSNSVSKPEHRRAFYETSMGPMLDAESEARKRMIESGGADEEKIGRIAKAFERWAETEEAWAGFVNGEIVCRNGE